VVHGYDAAAEWGAEIVHDHTLTGPVFGRQLSSIPVVTTNHGPFADDELGPFYRSIAEDIPVIAISHHHAATAAPTRIAEVIHHGVDLDGFPVGDGSGDYALFLGRMVPEKGVHTAIRAARLAGRPLVVAAKMREHHEQAYFEAEVEPLLGAGIEFVGEADAAEKLELLAGAACLLNPIDWPEPFGMVMAEALACGTPVLAHPRGSVPEIVDDGVTGFLRHHLDGLASCLHRVGELDRAACRQAVQERFSADRMVTAHIELYERVVGQATGRPEATAARRGRQR
jgi:glycosyltransferase involved in cell wall biosynthesis